MAFLARAKVPFGYEEISKVISSTREFNKFEEIFKNEIRSYQDCKGVWLFNLGRSALYLALKAANLNLGDKVICPSLCCLVVPEMILRLGATPVMVDVDPDIFNINTAKLNEVVDAKTKAIVPIHLFGQSADMAPIMDIAEDRGLYVIEDAAQAMGAEYNGRKVGSFGHAAIFSLGHGKNITAGEGGILTVIDDLDKDKMDTLYDTVHNATKRRALSNFTKQLGYSLLSHPFLYGLIQSYMDNTSTKRDDRFLNTAKDLYETMDSKNFYNDITRMSEIIAAIGLAQFKKLDYFNQKRIENANYFSKRINREGISIPYVAKNCEHVFLRYAIKLDHDELGVSREEVVNVLRSNGIDAETPYLYVREHNKLYRERITNECFPVTEELIDSIICLPVHPCLDTSDLEHITNVINEL